MPIIKKHLVFFLSVFILFITCDNNDKETDIRTPALTVTVRDDAGAFVDWWAFISDDDGKVIDAQRLFNNLTVDLLAQPEVTKLNLTLMGVRRMMSNTYYLRTYTDLPRGHDLYFRESSASPPGGFFGTAKFSINNYRELVTWNQGPVCFSTTDGLTTNFVHSPETDTYSAELSLFSSSPQDVLISAYRDGVLVYKTVQDAVVNSNYILDFDEFTPAETFFTVEGIQVFTDVFGYSDENKHSGYRVASVNEFNMVAQSKPLSIGYPDVFENYFTRVRKVESNVTKQFEKRGGPVSALEFPSLTYTATDSNIESFEAEISPEVTHKAGYWVGLFTHWRVFSPGSNRSVVKNIPDVIRNVYKDIETGQALNLYTVTVYKNNPGDYYSWLDARFNQSQSLNFEEFSTEFQLK